MITTLAIRSNPSSPRDASSRRSSDATSDASNNERSIATDSLSETSTIAHEQLPFEEYKYQVQQLCELLWPTTPKSHFAIERLIGGSYNRITGIKMSCQPNKPSSKELILRVPRSEWDARIDRDVAILRYVCQHTQVPVPHIEKYDITNQNPVKSPYMVQTRIPGIDLNSACAGVGLTEQQWCTVAQQLGIIMLQLQNATSTKPGIIEESRGWGLAEGFKVVPFEVKTPVSGPDRLEKLKAERAAGCQQTSSPRAFRSILHWFAFQFGSWKAIDLKRDPAGILHTGYPDRLVKVAIQMQEMGVFDKNEYCLCHLDLAARNIMTDISKDGDLTISGILDWDSAVMAPWFVSYKPPKFLWADPFDDYECDTDEARAQDIPTLASDQAIKRAFEETVGKEFLLYSYKPQYRLARQLYHLAVSGLHSNEHAKAAKLLIKEWATVYEDLKAEG